MAGEPARVIISSEWTEAGCNKARRSEAVTEPSEPLAFHNRYVHTLCVGRCCGTCATPGRKWSAANVVQCVAERRKGFIKLASGHRSCGEECGGTQGSVSYCEAPRKALQLCQNLKRIILFPLLAMLQWYGAVLADDK
jgi:hypothetical protein